MVAHMLIQAIIYVLAAAGAENLRDGFDRTITVILGAFRPGTLNICHGASRGGDRRSWPCALGPALMARGGRIWRSILSIELHTESLALHQTASAPLFAATSPGNQLRVQTTAIHLDTDDNAGNQNTMIFQFRAQFHW